MLKAALLVSAMALGAQAQIIPSPVPILAPPGVDGATIYDGTTPGNPIPVNVAKIINVRAYPDNFWGAQRYHHFVAKAGSLLQFEFPVSHDIYYMNTKAAFDACDFRNAAKLADGDTQNNPDGTINKKNQYSFLLNSPGMNYFACSYNGDCNNGSQKLSVEVRGGAVSCSDGVMNQGELGIDCGAAACGVPCINCSDNKQNGDETGIDCGGSCNAPCVATCPTQVQTAFAKCRTRGTKDACDKAIYKDGTNVNCSWCKDTDPVTPDGPPRIGCTFNNVCRNPGAVAPATPYAIEADEDKCIGKIGPDGWIAGTEKGGFLDDPFTKDGETPGGISGTEGNGIAEISFDDKGYPEGTIFRVRSIPGNASNQGPGSPLRLTGLSEDTIAAGGYQFKVSIQAARRDGEIGAATALPATGNPNASGSKASGQDDTIIIVLIVVGVVFVCVVAGLGAQYVLRGSSNKGGGSSRAKERFDLGTSPVKV